MNFSDVPGSLRVWVTTFITVVAGFTIVYNWVGLLHTDVEAAVHVDDFVGYQEQQLQSDKQDRVDRVKREIDRIDYDLLSEDLSARQREYLENKRRDLAKQIECIRRDEC